MAERTEETSLIGADQGPSVPAELATLWARTGVHVSSLERRGDGTLVASGRTALATEDTMLASASGEVEALALSPEALELASELGRGGMGAVHLADQLSLRREVAVKVAHDRHDPRARSSLLKEAWVGGQLEHPHVVPVHTLAAHDGAPAIVMKRVEGRSFLSALEEPDRDAHLERHLRVLIACCRAIAFAHSRGILHLDLKPDNVMLGAFGEVYVVDWGLAAGLSDDKASWLPPASSITGIAGTPGYMAPELSAGDATRIDARTDVYLLGGMLHTILTGEPRHAGDNLMAVLLAAFLSEPPELPGAPPELRAIVRRATHVDPEQRYASADALREALEGFLRHRLAERLASQAARMLDALGAEVARGAGDVEIEPRLAECAQAIREARREWPAHPELEVLSEALLERRLQHAIAHDRVEAADAVLAQMKQPGDAHRAQLEAARARVSARRAHVARLEDMSRELDLTLGTASRRATFGILGAIFFLISLVLGYLTRSGIHRIGYTELLVEGALLVATLVPYGYWNRRRLFVNVANRRLYGGLTLTALTVEVHWIVGVLLDIPVPHAVAVTPLMYTFAFATLAVSLDRRIYWGAAAMALAAAAAALWPSWALDIVGIGGGLAVFSILAAWRRAQGPSA